MFTATDVKRFSRQTSLPEFGWQGQAILERTSILCVGAGGLGSPALSYLAASGIRKLGVIDGDVVELSNLPRQILFDEKDVGNNKAEVAFNKLHTQVKLMQYFPHALNPEWADRLFPEFDIIIDASDNFSCKYLINDAAYKHQRAFVFASVSGFEGRLASFIPHLSSCYRCLYEKPPSLTIQNCEQAGILGPVAGAMGVLQALESLKIALYLHKHSSAALTPILGKMLIFDFASYQQRILNIPKNPTCPTCSQKSHDIQLKQEQQECHSDRGLRWSDYQKNHYLWPIFDIREYDEYSLDHIPEAIHKPLSHWEDLIHSVSQLKAPCLLYCHSGKRTHMAITKMKSFGIDQIFYLDGGFEAFKHTNVST